jgi:hypothetical protein
VPNITITNNDLGKVALEVWGSLDATLQNVVASEQSYLEGTLLGRDPATGNLLPYAPATVPDSVVDVTVDVASIPTLEATDTAVVVPGALVGDIIDIEPLGTWPVGITLPQGRCLVAGTVQVRIANVTAGAVDPASQLLRFSLTHAANALSPKYVLTYPVTIGASTTARVTVMSAGKVNSRRLKVHGAPPTAATAADIDALLDRPIIPLDLEQLAKVENPQP